MDRTIDVAATTDGAYCRLVREVSDSSKIYEHRLDIRVCFSIPSIERNARTKSREEGHAYVLQKGKVKKS